MVLLFDPITEPEWSPDPLKSILGGRFLPCVTAAKHTFHSKPGVLGVN